MASNPYQYTGSGQGFLTDYSPLAAVGSAFQGFAEAYANAQDRSMKKMETLAQIEALKAKTQRDYEASQIDAASKGFNVDPTTHAVSEAPLGPRERTANQLKAISGGARETGFTDTAGNPAFEPNPDFWRTQQAQGMWTLRKQGMENQNKRIDLMGRRFEETQNQNAQSAGNKIVDDPVMNDMQTARYSLSRGRSLLNGATPLTYNNLNAVQQDVINGMTKGGQSSEGKVSREMQESWRGAWNNIMAKAGKYGENNDIRKQDPGLAAQISALLEDVDGTIGQNMSDRYKRLSSVSGQTTNPKTKKVIQDLGAQYNTPGVVKKGLVEPGLVDPGLVAKAPEKQYAPDVLAYAKKWKIQVEEAQKLKDERGEK